MIDALINKLKSFESNIPDYLKQEIMDNEAYICDMNSEVQLFEKGIDANNKSIMSRRPYSPITMELKRLKGQPTNRVTLKDTGDFYASLFIVADSNSFFIDSTDDKTLALVEKYGDDILGLTDDNINELAWEYIYPALLERIKNELL